MRISAKLLFTLIGLAVQDRGAEWIEYLASAGPGSGKRIVLVSGDEEYRSEEALPCLARILSTHHGFDCRVLFAITDGFVDPTNSSNIPGLEALEDADLMIIATRFRDLPDNQMRYIDRYLKRGGPVIGLRTATHAFKIPAGKTYDYCGDGYAGDREDWTGGFGRRILGERWISHHGQHGRQATRGVIPPESEGHPILRGCEDIFGPTDVYTVRLPLPGDSRILVLGAVLEGMNPGDPPVPGGKNDPMMPVAWIKSYQIGGGDRGRVFTTTMGAAGDLLSEGVRRMIVNAAYWCTGLEDRIPIRSNVEFVGDYRPAFFGFKTPEYWKERRLLPEQLR